jgi:transcriptional regulator with XRE-family HTH domain
MEAIVGDQEEFAVQVELARIYAEERAYLASVPPYERKRRRKEKLGWSRATAAKLLRCAPSTFARYEAGEAAPMARRLAAYVELLRVADGQEPDSAFAERDEDIELLHLVAELRSYLANVQPAERRRRREEGLGWSQSNAAEWLGCAPSTFATYEDGVVVPCGRALYAYCEMLRAANGEDSLFFGPSESASEPATTRA